MQRRFKIRNMAALLAVSTTFTVLVMAWASGWIGRFWLERNPPRLADTPSGGLVIRYPRTGTLFPPEIPAPTVVWKDSSADGRTWMVVVRSETGKAIASAFQDRPEWRPSERSWQRIKAAGLERNLTVSVFGVRGASVRAGAGTVIRVSRDSVGAPIFFRAVPLPFDFAKKNLDSIRWHLGDVASPGPPPALLRNLPLCGNCHSFSRDGTLFAMDVDYANDKGSYVISPILPKTVLTPDKIITWCDYRREDGQKTFGLLSQVSPDGRFVLSTVKDRSIFVTKDDFAYSQLFFPVKGILAVYDRKARRFSALPGADDPAFVQSNPVWSPDGSLVYFAKARTYRSAEAERSDEVVLPRSVAAEFLEGRRGFQFDVYQIPFHAGGGGKPEPLPGASANGMSNYFPRPSPDGKWIVFTQARNFMLLQPDSKLAILPAGGGAARRMACNTDSMNSWHSWSPNGRWLAFASKVRGPYTDVCLTHVDSAGQDTPPVVLERFHTPDRAANIPEFVNVKPSAFAVLVDRFSDQPHYYLTVGRNRLGEKKIREAIPYFDKVISADSAFPDAYVFKGHAHFMLGEYRDAVAAYDKAISLGYRDRDTQVNRGSALYNLKDYRAAVRAYSEAIAIDPKHALAFVARGKAIAKTGDLRRAIADFDRAVALGNRSEETFTERGLCRALLDEYAPALEDFRAALKIRPENAETRKMAGKALFQLGRFKEAADAYTEAIRFAGNDREAYSSRAACRSRTNDLRGAIDDYDQALRIDPSSAVDMYRRGRIKINIGDRAAGCADLARAQALGFPDASVELRRYCGS